MTYGEWKEEQPQTVDRYEELLSIIDNAYEELDGLWLLGKESN